MKVVKVQFHKADKPYFFLPEFIQSKEEVKVGDIVLVETILGQDLGKIITLADFQEDKKEENKSGTIPQAKTSDIKPLLRKANEKDLKQLAEISEKYSEYLKECKNLSKQHDLDNMKLIDVSESIDQQRLTFYFTASSRIDFRELVRDLAKKFNRKIRLQQIGVRDEAKCLGDSGPCGLQLCCKSWLSTLGNVSPEYIKDQELIHRGADRLTGVCGRLKCCLRYEEETYKYYLGKLPKEGDVIKTKAGKGRVISIKALKHIVKLDINGTVVEYPFLEGNIKEECKECNGKCGCK